MKCVGFFFIPGPSFEESVEDFFKSLKSQVRIMCCGSVIAIYLHYEHNLGMVWYNDSIYIHHIYLQILLLVLW